MLANMYDVYDITPCEQKYLVVKKKSAHQYILICTVFLHYWQRNDYLHKTKYEIAFCGRKRLT